MQKDQKIFSDKSVAIDMLIEQAAEHNHNLYLKKIRYGANDSYEYRIILFDEVLNYCEEYYVGHYYAASKQWICFNPSDRKNVYQAEAKRKSVIIIP
jgi:hypothetical protein